MRDPSAPLLTVCIVLPQDVASALEPLDPLGDDALSQTARIVAERWGASSLDSPLFGIWEALGLDNPDHAMTITLHIPNTPDAREDVRSFVRETLRPLFRGAIRVWWIHPPITQVEWESF